MFGRRLPDRQRWVSKTDLSRWYRCPYAYWLLESGQITFPETVSTFQKSLIRAGQDYQELVEQPATPITISPVGLPALLRTEITILGTPLFENKQLQLRGCPDGIDAASARCTPSRSSPTGHPLTSTGWSSRLLAAAAAAAPHPPGPCRRCPHPAS